MTQCTFCGEKYDHDLADGRCILCRNKTARTAVISDKVIQTQRQTRDLHADLAICDKATPGRWHVYDTKLGRGHTYGSVDGVLVMIAEGSLTADATFIAESRQGWPEAIRRAIAAEAEVERLREIIGCAAFDLHYAEHYSSTTMDVLHRLQQEVDGWEGTRF
ncbi:hypothetical protein M5X06_12625 [Paenibacillus alvei]|uniref:Uncharacterized protein n=1 Tax=Paenibacillus alvei TaxID=44250 RepID=A0ABT4GUI9_PAEAL|nr:hypothetical protein [Paenibacillus alvei]MCY9760364.1 hypothetical protein [Paenibacillus alvei]MCY9767656.1 hypothetical protein [Paenibacillus alvei]